MNIMKTRSGGWHLMQIEVLVHHWSF